MADPIPAGLENRFVPYLMIDGAADAIDFYGRAFAWGHQCSLHTHIRDVSPEQMAEAMRQADG